MAKSLIRKNQLHPDISDLVAEYGSGVFIPIGASGVQYIDVTGENLVYKTGDQTIDGEKTFYKRPNVNGSGVLLQGEVASVQLPNTIVYTTGDQTISGSKTFESSEYIFSGAPVSFIDERPTVNGTGILLSGEAVETDGSIKKIISMSQTTYNSLSPNYNVNTMYVITGV